MRKGRPRYPQPRDVFPVIRAIQKHIPLDTPMTYGMRESVSHVPNFRIQAVTSEISWTVDIYHRGFYYVQIAGDSEKFTTIPLLLNYLRKKLDFLILW
jgi:hypothetical protein